LDEGPPGPDEVEPLHVVDITEDDAFDDDARARLIAAAVAEAVADEGSPGHADASLQDAGSADVEDSVGSAPAAETSTGDPRPLLPADALLALSEIHREGLASVPVEHIIDLGEATTERERDRLLVAALAHAEMQDAKYRVPTESSSIRRWKGGIAGALLLLAGVTAASPPSFVAPPAAGRPTVADAEQGVRLALMLQVEQVEAFRVVEGRLPGTLDELPQSVAGVRFVRSTDRMYQLVARAPDGRSIVYDSAAPDVSLETTRRPWDPIQGTR
jgi:hypothetical protein